MRQSTLATRRKATQHLVVRYNQQQTTEKEQLQLMATKKAGKGGAKKGGAKKGGTKKGGAKKGGAKKR